MIKFPYGVSDFHRIRADGYLYVDRSAFIPVLEDAGRQLIFLRPRPRRQIAAAVDAGELL